MRFRHADGSLVHLAYCANVHPAETLAGIRERLSAVAVPARRRLGAGRIGVGLWLPRGVARTLDGDPAALSDLRDWLTDNGIEVVTLNGFPYQGFGDDVVKTAVYRPDWSTRARLDYTLELARILGHLLPEDAVDGSVSTLPLGWADWWEPQRTVLSRGHLSRLADGLSRVRDDTGRRIRVGFEPEPGCVVETSGDVAGPLAAAIASGVHPRHRDTLGVCLDTCHLAVAFEDPAEALGRLRQVRLPLVKLQASAALHVDHPHSADTRAALSRFAEPRFLHQTRYPAAPGDPAPIGGTHDLPEALALLDRADPPDGPWRVHFHMPLHGEPPGGLRTTRDVLASTLSEVLGGPTALVRHVEVETYTWPVLPAERAGEESPDDTLAAGIAGELAWTREHLIRLGLTEEP
ncbi:metabolite traffic protein EboE [Spiractinospora alimapuensis]|uniref:metabolite traffic protein EboE n=1 Tax=Spiractinospora alimapuensis TaxID=2820884 RepID=UPI001F333125|nr:metabolite traffic protein EboE [Spiractinospora alimapuensis]QVQ52411.1 metabolite traffic protein EboE [Spiractinospora alimapuensis]